MTTTSTHIRTIAEVFNSGDADEIADCIRKVQLGTMLTPLKRTFTGLTSGASFDLTAIDGVGETVGSANPNRLAALCVSTLRVTTGTATGVRIVGDIAATLSTTVARLSDDGKTVYFEAAITAFVIEYIPRAAIDPTTEFAAAS
jgi:hypothetical protein